MLGNTSQLVAILLPVLGILLVTSEWSQHTLWQDAGRAFGYAFVFQVLNVLLGAWAQVATTAAAWIALPALVGGWHVLHRPVNA